MSNTQKLEWWADERSRHASWEAAVALPVENGVASSSCD